MMIPSGWVYGLFTTTKPWGLRQRSQPLGGHGVMNVSPPLWLGMYNSTSATIDRSNSCGWFIHLGGNQEHIN